MAMKKFAVYLASGVLTTIAASFIAALIGSLENRHEPADVYTFSFGELFIFYSSYLCPVVLFFAVVFSPFNHAMAAWLYLKKYRSSILKYLWDVLYYAAASALVHIVYFNGILHDLGPPSIIAVVGAILAVIYYHILLGLTKIFRLTDHG
jgi:hypothetical protein